MRTTSTCRPFFDVQGGYEIISAATGAEGIAKAAAEQPDLILMDLNLPEIDGWEATRRLKADPSTCEIPIIALTAHAMAGDREKALATGCDDFDTKPVEFDRLLANRTGTGQKDRRAGARRLSGLRELTSAYPRSCRSNWAATLRYRLRRRVCANRILAQDSVYDAVTKRLADTAEDRRRPGAPLRRRVLPGNSQSMLSGPD